MASKDIQQFADAATAVLRAMWDSNSPYREELEKRERKGGYLCVSLYDGNPLVITPVGQPDLTIGHELIRDCQMEARLLAIHESHTRSSKCPSHDRSFNGAAVRGESYIISFSWVHRELSEILCAMVLYALADTEREALADLLAGNDLASPHAIQFLVNALESAYKR